MALQFEMSWIGSTAADLSVTNGRVCRTIYTSWPEQLLPEVGKYVLLAMLGT